MPKIGSREVKRSNPLLVCMTIGFVIGAVLAIAEISTSFRTKTITGHVLISQDGIMEIAWGQPIKGYGGVQRTTTATFSLWADSIAPGDPIFIYQDGGGYFLKLQGRKVYALQVQLR